MKYQKYIVAALLVLAMCLTGYVFGEQRYIVEAAGYDNAVWFANPWQNKTGRLQVAALQLTATPIPPTFMPPIAKVVAEWKISDPGAIVAGFDSIWVPGHHSLTTTRIDPISNKITAVIKGTGFRAEQALAVGDKLWVTGQINDTTWIDPNTNTVSTTVPGVKGQHHSIAHGFDSLWITTGNNKLDRIDPATSEIITSIQLEDGSADCQNGVLATTDAVWVEFCDKGELIKVDPVTNTVASKTAWSKLIDDAQAQTALPTGNGTDFIWLSLAGDEGTDSIPAGLLRIDPITITGLTFLPYDTDQYGPLAVTDDAVWVAGSGQINRVNVATNQIDATYATDSGDIQATAVGFGSLWLANYSKSLIQRLDVAP